MQGGKKRMSRAQLGFSPRLSNFVAHTPERQNLYESASGNPSSPGSTRFERLRAVRQEMRMCGQNGPPVTGNATPNDSRAGETGVIAVLLQLRQPLLVPAQPYHQLLL